MVRGWTCGHDRTWELFLEPETDRHVWSDTVGSQVTRPNIFSCKAKCKADDTQMNCGKRQLPVKRL
jgi:hypothetical protein